MNQVSPIEYDRFYDSGKNTLDAWSLIAVKSTSQKNCLRNTLRSNIQCGVFRHIPQGCEFRVATAQGKQGKQGIWFLLFPDRENTGNFALTQGKILRHRENIFL